MRRFLLICLIIVTSVSAEAQKLFSDDVNVFYGEAVRAIESVGTEAANKVSFDFRNAWKSKYTTEQKEKYKL